MVWGSKTFMAFGGGVRLCVGAEFARLQMAIFIHHLVTYYDFSLVQDCEVTRTPFLQFTKGLLINISQSSTKWTLQCPSPALCVESFIHLLCSIYIILESIWNELNFQLLKTIVKQVWNSLSTIQNSFINFLKDSRIRCNKGIWFE